MIYIFIFFFFSSRRRHTRSKRDWSSDVCSSDLLRDTPAWATHWMSNRDRRERPCGSRERSEERRVGKECRSRWSPQHYKTNRAWGLRMGPRQNPNKSWGLVILKKR